MRASYSPLNHANSRRNKAAGSRAIWSFDRSLSESRSKTKKAGHVEACDWRVLVAPLTRHETTGWSRLVRGPALSHPGVAAPADAVGTDWPVSLDRLIWRLTWPPRGAKIA